MIFEEMLKEERAEGFAKGREEGLQEGRSTLKETLLLFLQSFGDVPDEVLEQILCCSAIENLRKFQSDHPSEIDSSYIFCANSSNSLTERRSASNSSTLPYPAETESAPKLHLECLQTFAKTRVGVLSKYFVLLQVLPQTLLHALLSIVITLCRSSINPPEPPKREFTTSSFNPALLE